MYATLSRLLTGTFPDEMGMKSLASSSEWVDGEVNDKLKLCRVGLSAFSPVGNFPRFDWHEEAYGWGGLRCDQGRGFSDGKRASSRPLMRRGTATTPPLELAIGVVVSSY